MKFQKKENIYRDRDVVFIFGDICTIFDVVDGKNVRFFDAFGFM